jgi:EAL domain-containing protein (putative c-di-GMP-specific phosphodiesterase class I)
VRQAQAWADEGIDVGVSVNLSGADLRSHDVVDEVRAALADFGLPAERLELEVTETAVLANQQTAGELVEALRAMGVSIALDDFGTGYASLTYLKRLKPGRLKIDRSFVEGMASEAVDSEIARSLIDLAHSLGIGVTAEGVETAEQWRVLARLGCDLVQGYYLARPLAAEAATDWLRARATSLVRR